MATKVHRIRYYNPKPQPINCITLNIANKNLALARSDASIEIWDLNYAPYLLNFIPGVENGSVEALGWVHDRLLSTGLGGALVEWDLEKLRVRNSILLTGYAAWCLDVSSDNTMVAVGTEQGYVNLYNVENNEIVYKKLFDKQEGRILCCKFNKTGNILVTGSINTIRVWNVETGQATTRMSVSRRGKEVIVWCITILSDDTVVSGDSHGRLTFWDNIIGNELESYITHKADILSIAVSEDENSLFCSGVDPVISNFVKIKNKQDSDAQWVKHVQRNIHEHDVRGLVLNGKELISVGIDGYLTFSSYPPKWVMRIPHMLPAPRSSVCAQKKLLLLRYSHHIEVWKLGSCTVNDSDNALIKDNIHREDCNHQVNNIEEDSIMDKIKITINNVLKQSLRITEKPVKLVSVQTKGKKQIKSCELSPSGEFIVYSTDSHIRMLKLETDEDQSNISLSKVMVNGVSSGCERFAFTNDSRWMVVYCTGNLNVLQVDPEAGATVVQSLPVEKHLSTKSIVHLLVSKETRAGTTYLMVADTLGSVTVWKRSGKKFEHYIDLPKYQCVPSAMAVDNECENLIITYVDQKIVEYDLANKKFTEWPGSGVSPEWYQRSAAVESIVPHPNGDAVLFQDLTALWVMDRRLQEQNEPDLKKKFQRSGDMNFGLKVIPIKYIADFHWIGKDEAVLLEVLPENIVSQLPAVAVTNKKRDRI